MTKPPLPTIHHLACSGGTIISRCIAAMKNVALLSEQHPDQIMARRVHPLHQAINAGIPVTFNDIHASFSSQIITAHKRAQDAGLMLCLRDHTHRDFFEADRNYSLTIDVLSEHFHVLPLCTIRDPIDIFLGLQQAGWLRHDIPEFCRRFLSFAAVASTQSPIRYEQFASDPDTTIREICDRLTLPFDPEFKTRLNDVTHMTGSSGRQSLDIKPRPRRQIENKIGDAFLKCTDYHESIQLLGYEPCAASI